MKTIQFNKFYFLFFETFFSYFTAYFYLGRKVSQQFEKRKLGIGRVQSLTQKIRDQSALQLSLYMIKLIFKGVCANSKPKCSLTLILRLSLKSSSHRLLYDTSSMSSLALSEH